MDTVVFLLKLLWAIILLGGMLVMIIAMNLDKDKRK